MTSKTSLSKEFIEKNKQLLNEIWEMVYNDYAYDVPNFHLMEAELVNNISKDIETTISFFEILDLNDIGDRHIVSLIPAIATSLQKIGKLKEFVDFVQSLQEKYPNCQFPFFSLIMMFASDVSSYFIDYEDESE